METSVILSPIKPRIKYSPELAEQLLYYFSQAPQAKTEVTRVIVEQSRWPSKRQEVQTICAEIPTFERFATSIGCHIQTMLNWRKVHPEWDDAYERCKQIQKDFLIQGLATGRISPLAGIFLAKNMTDMKDDQTMVVKPETTEKPALADRTPAELEKLREMVMAAEKIGMTITIEDAPVEA